MKRTTHHLKALGLLALALVTTPAEAITFSFLRTLPISSNAAANNGAFVQDIAVLPTGDFFIADPFSNNAVRFLDASGQNTIRNGGAYTDRPSGLTRLPNGNLLVSSWDGTPSMQEVNATTFALVPGGINFGSQLRAEGVAFSRGTIYTVGAPIPGGGLRVVQSFDTAGNLLSSFPIGPDTFGLEINPENGNLLIADASTIREYDPTNGTDLGEVLAVESAAPISGLAMSVFRSQLLVQTSSSDGFMEVQVFSFPSRVPFEDFLDYPGLEWISSGNSNWIAQATTTHDGVDAVASGDIEDSQTSTLETSVAGPAFLTFWWKVSSEAGFDFLRFFLDDVEQPGAVGISGDIDWQKITVPIPSGSHTLRWTYSKDGSESSLDDTAWLDEVALNSIVPGVDTDGDGLTDLDELVTHGTNPLLADTDGDGCFNDGQEVANGTDPLDPNSPAPLPHGGALYLDGDGDFVTFENLDGLIPTGDEAFTIEAWINPTSIPTGAANGGQITFWGNEGPVNAANGLRLAGDSAVRHYFWGNDHDEPLGFDILDDTSGPNGDGWNHVAITFDGSTAGATNLTQLYLNGAPLGAPRDAGSGVAVADGNFRIGSRLNAEFFHGFIDELRIWDNPRTPADIQSGFNRQVDPATAGLVAYWDFANGATDKTGRGHDGILQGDAYANLCTGAPVAPFIPPTAVTYELTYNGDGGASATGTITLDTALLPNPGEFFNAPTLTAGVLDFRLVVSGASSGNGTFVLGDVNNWIWNAPIAVDFYRELVGQITDFNLGTVGQALGAPVGVGAFTISTNSGDRLTLISMTPLRPAPYHWDFRTLPDGPVVGWFDSNHGVPAELLVPENGDPTKNASGVCFDGDDALSISSGNNPVLGLEEWSATVVFCADGALGEGGATQADQPDPNNLQFGWWGNASLVGCELPGFERGDWMLGLNRNNNAVIGNDGTGGDYVHFSGAPLNDGAVHVMTGVWSTTGGQQLYLDGVQVFNDPLALVLPPEEQIHFGVNIPTVPIDRAYYTGKIKEIFLHDYSLSEQEVFALQASLSSAAPSLVDVAFNPATNTVTLTYDHLTPGATYHVATVGSIDGVNVIRTAVADSQFTPAAVEGSATVTSDESANPTRVFQIMDGALVLP